MCAATRESTAISDDWNRDEPNGDQRIEAALIVDLTVLSLATRRVRCVRESVDVSWRECSPRKADIVVRLGIIGSGHCGLIKGAALSQGVFSDLAPIVPVGRVAMQFG